MSGNDAKSKRDLYMKFVKRLIKYQGLYKNSYKYQVIFDRIEQEIQEASDIQSNSEHPTDEFINSNIPDYLLNFASKIDFLRSTSVAQMQTDILRNNSNGLIDIIPSNRVPRNNGTDIGPFIVVPQSQHLSSRSSSICVYQTSQENKKNINICKLAKEKREIYQIVCRPLSIMNMQNLIIYHTSKHLKLLKIQPKSEASDIEDDNQFEIDAKHCFKLKNIKHFTTNIFHNDCLQNPNPIFYEPRVFALSQSGNISSFDCNSGVLSSMCEKSLGSPSNLTNREGISSISPNILIHFGGKNVSVIDMRLSSKTPSAQSSNQIYANSVTNIQSDYGDIFCLQKSQCRSLNFYLTSRNNVELFDLRKANNSLKSTHLSLFGYPDLTDVLLGPNTSANGQNNWEEYLAVACRDSNETRVIKIDKGGQNMTVSYLKNISNFDVDNSVTLNGESKFEEIKKPNLCGLKFQNCNNVPHLYQLYSNNSILSSNLLDDINEWQPDSKISLPDIKKTQNYDENESYIDADSFSLSNFIRGMKFKPRDAHPLCLVCNSNEIFVSKSQATESHEKCPKCGLNQSQQASLKSGIDNELLTLNGMGNRQHAGDSQEAWNLDDNWDPEQYEDIPSQFVKRLFYDKNADLSDIQIRRDLINTPKKIIHSLKCFSNSNEPNQATSFLRQLKDLANEYPQLNDGRDSQINKYNPIDNIDPELSSKKARIPEDTTKKKSEKIDYTLENNDGINNNKTLDEVNEFLRSFKDLSD